MEHVDDLTLAALALDDAADVPVEDVAAARAHLAVCERCQEEATTLADLLVLAHGPAETLTAPPPQVWQAVQAELRAEGRGGHQDDRPAERRTDAEGRQESVGGTVVPLPPRRTVPAWLASVAAAAALVVGLGVGGLMGGDDAPPVATPEPTPSPAVLGSTQLASLEDDAEVRGSAEVRRHDDRVVLHVDPRDLEGPDGIREVWLINVDGTRMVSLGLLTPNHSGDFEFPEQLLDEGYRIVDISYEPDDGDPVHSGQSLARGTIDS